MTAKEYLSQGYRLEQRIKLAKMEIRELEELIGFPGSPGFEEHFNPNRQSDAPFVKTLMKIMKMQEKVNDELSQLLELKKELKYVINQVSDKDEQLVLSYRYIYSWSWSQIGDEMYADERTVRRWHNKALAHVVVPSNPIII